MTERRFQLYTLLRAFENETVLGEALHFPEVSRLGASPAKVTRAVAANARAIAERQPPIELFHRTAPSEPHTREFTVNLDAPRGAPLWKGQLPICFRAAVWEVPGAGWSCRVPALGIELFTERHEDLEPRASQEILLALHRENASADLWMLSRVRRETGLVIQPGRLSADIRTPREEGMQDSRKPAEASVLAQVAQDLTAQPPPRAFGYAELTRRLAEALSEPRPESVLLVGPGGVGKTALFLELVRRRDELNFASTPFWGTSGSRLVAGMSGFGMWQQRCDKLRLEAARTRAILHLGNLVELMEVGKGMMIQQGIAGFLRPFIARGELLCVVECTPEQLPLIERQDPHLMGVFHALRVPEPEPEAARVILRSAADELSEAAGQEWITPGALATLDRLHRRYATYSAYPGRPLRFLRNLPEAVTDTGVYAAFSRETGLPTLMLDPSVPMVGPEVRAFFTERVIGQPAAVERVSDLLATIKSGLARPRKPLASFLFVGPTGVGKTETAKALAEFLFHDRRRITRFDMSEHADPAGVQRLIGGAFGEDGLLTARVREQPFAVLLFDEFEKAHPLFFDLLLQILGEARLTDAGGRLADFSNTVIIMTSNLGAEGYMQGGIGFGDRDPDAEQHFGKALRDFARPELLNRIDRVVPFLPLNEHSVLQIVNREIELVERRPGLRDTGTRLEVTEAARKRIAERAYQPALGARPLKREIERELLVPLAEALNTLPTVYALHAVADVVGGELRVEVNPLAGEDARPRARAGADAWLSKLGEEATNLRRKLQVALASEALLRLRSEGYRLGRSLDMERRKRRKHPDRAPSSRAAEAGHRLTLTRSVLRAFESANERVCELEDRLRLGALVRSRLTEPPARQELEDRRGDWADALRDLMRVNGGGGGTNDATLYIYSHHSELMFQLARGYREWARKHAKSTTLCWATRELAPDDRRELQRRAEFDSACVAALRRLRDLDARAPESATDDPELFPPMDAGHFLDAPREEPGAVVMRVEGADIALMLRLEAGNHRFRVSGDADPVDVDVQVLAGDLWNLDLPVPRGMAGGLPPRRHYDLAQHQAKDELLGQVVAWTANHLEGVLTRCIGAGFERHLEGQVGL